MTVSSSVSFKYKFIEKTIIIEHILKDFFFKNIVAIIEKDIVLMKKDKHFTLFYPVGFSYR